MTYDMATPRSANWRREQDCLREFYSMRGWFVGYRHTPNYVPTNKPSAYELFVTNLSISQIYSSGTVVFHPWLNDTGYDNWHTNIGWPQIYYPPVNDKITPKQTKVCLPFMHQETEVEYVFVGY